VAIYENRVKFFTTYIFSNTRIIKTGRKAKLLFRRWQAMATCVYKKMHWAFCFTKQSSVWQRLFYITTNYGYKCI